MQQSLILLVPGDLACSPRMLYHLQSLLREGYRVNVIVYLDTPLPSALAEHSDLHLFPLASPGAANRHRLSKPLFVLYTLARVIRQSMHLAWLLLWRLPRADWLLVQNPPSIPSLMLAAWTARLRGMRWMVDWHNFGFTLLGLKLGNDHLFTRLSARLEKRYGRMADAHLCVSHAMQDELQSQWGLRGVTCFHDHAPASFADTKRVNISNFVDPIPSGFDQAKVLVSSSSWTADEDFDLLLDALQHYDKQTGKAQPLLVILTGKGAGRETFERRISEAGLNQVAIRTTWLSAENYSRLLASADLGLCLHRSSSGVDLPMKVADMLGAGLPVCAYDYGETLREQLQHGFNGRLFKTSGELVRTLIELFNHNDGRDMLTEMQTRCRNNRPPDWHSHWLKTVLPILEQPASQDPGRIAFVHPTLGMGGAERWLLDTAVALQADGYRVEIYCNSYNPARAFAEFAERRIPVTVLGGFLPSHILQRLRAPCAVLRMLWISLRLRFAQKRFDVLLVDLVSHNLPLLGRNLAQWIIFYGHYPDQYLTGPLTGFYAWYRWPLDRLERLGLQAADDVCVNSDFTRQRFRQAFPQQRVRVCHPGIDISRYAQIPALAEDVTKLPKITLQVVSRIHPDKNLALAIETLDSMRHLPFFARLRVVYTGGYDSRDQVQRDTLSHLKAMANTRQLSLQVEFRLNITDNELIALYGEATALLYTPPQEHFGLVPLEAMAAARPVIASNQGGTLETILDGETLYPRST